MINNITINKVKNKREKTKKPHNKVYIFSYHLFEEFSIKHPFPKIRYFIE